MKTYVITFRKRYHTEVLSREVDARTFGDCEERFIEEQEEDNLILLSITLKFNTLLT
jgi:hypothetical protein